MRARTRTPTDMPGCVPCHTPTPLQPVSGAKKSWDVGSQTGVVYGNGVHTPVLTAKLATLGFLLLSRAGL